MHRAQVVAHAPPDPMRTVIVARFGTLYVVGDFYQRLVAVAVMTTVVGEHPLCMRAGVDELEQDREVKRKRSAARRADPAKRALDAARAKQRRAERAA